MPGWVSCNSSRISCLPGGGRWHVIPKGHHLEHSACLFWKHGRNCSPYPWLGQLIMTNLRTQNKTGSFAIHYLMLPAQMDIEDKARSSGKPSYVLSKANDWRRQRCRDVFLDCTEYFNGKLIELESSAEFGKKPFGYPYFHLKGRRGGTIRLKM